MICMNCFKVKQDKGCRIKKGKVITPSCRTCMAAYNDEVLINRKRCNIPHFEAKSRTGRSTVIVCIHKDYL